MLGELLRRCDNLRNSGIVIRNMTGSLLNLPMPLCSNQRMPVLTDNTSTPDRKRKKFARPEENDATNLIEFEKATVNANRR